MHIIYANSKGLPTLKAGDPFPYPDGTVFADDVHEFSVKDGSYVEGNKKAVTVLVKDAKKYGTTGFSSGLARGLHFFNRTSFVALCTRLSKNSESRNRAFTAFTASAVSAPHILKPSCVPPALVKYGTGHAKSSNGKVVQQTVTDKYIKMGKTRNSVRTLRSESDSVLNCRRSKRSKLFQVCQEKTEVTGWLPGLDSN